MDILKRVEELQDLFDEDEVTTADKINRPEPKQSVKEIELFNEFNIRNPKADGGRILFDKGGAAKFRKFIQDFDGKIYKGFVTDQANKFNIDRKTASTIIKSLREDINKKLVEANYDITKSQLEGGKSYADKIKERKDRVAKANVNTPNSTEFKKLSEEFVKDPKYKIKSNANFAKFLNKKGKTATGGKKFTGDNVERRRSRLGMTSPVTTEALVNKNFKELKAIATDIGVTNVDDIKDRKKLLTKIYERRASEIKKFKRATDPEFQAREKKTREKYVKANPEKIKKAVQNARQRNAAINGFPPPAYDEKEELWRSLFVDGRKYKKGRRLKTIGLEKYGQYVPRPEFLNAKILDTKTGKQITFKNLENYINKNTPYKYEKVLQPYAQKWFINNTPGLRTEINSKLIKNYKLQSGDNFFEIQHNAGRYNDPFDVSLTNKDINLKESTARTRFDKAWSASKNLSDKKKAFQTYTDSLPREILSKPSMVKRTRYFGKKIPFEQQLRDLKQRGVVLPRGTLKKAAKISGAESGFIDLGLFKDIGKGTGAVLKAVPTLAPTAALTAGFGVDPTSAIDRASIAAEAAFAPALVQQAAKFRPAVQKFLNLGLSPALAARVARVASPLGIASLIGEATIAGAKNISQEANRIDSIKDPDLQSLEFENLIRNIKGFADGGLSGGDKSGPPPESGPTPHGLQGILNRVKRT